MQFNEQQTRAIRCRGHSVVVSVPGSGKTRVLVYKAIDILEREPEAPIMLVTFTRDASVEIRERIETAYGKIPAHVNIGTFHGLSSRLLARNKKPHKALPAGEQMQLLHRAYKPFARDLDWESALHAVQSYKSQLNPDVRDDTTHGCLYIAYQTLLEERHGMDFDDLLLHSTRGMLNGTLQPLPCRYLLLDEAQDTDPVQMEWVECHLRNGAEITMVGDDDQSIYGWRSAAGYRGMLEFEKQHNAQRITLDTNYRSCAGILEVADRLIRHNTARMNKHLVGVHQERGQVEYHEFENRVEEAYAILQAIAENPYRWAVLARTNYLLDVLDAVLKAHNMESENLKDPERKKIPYYRPGSRQIWSAPHIASPLSTIYALAIHCRDGSRTSKELAEIAKGIEPMLVLIGIDEEEIRDLRKSGNLVFDQLMSCEQLLTPEDREDLQTLIGLIHVWEENYRQYMRSTDPTDQMHERNTVVNAVFSWYKAMYRKHSRKSRMDLDMTVAIKILGRMKSPLDRAIEILRQPPLEDRKKREGAALLTLHGTKGLEFPNVWIIGMESNYMPHAESPEPEEERRLCYVGMTRAKQRLVLSSIQKSAPSRFLTESGILQDYAASA